MTILVVTNTAASRVMELKVDWPSFMARQDPKWDRMPQNYFEGPFIGNGLVGGILYQDKESPNTLHLELGRVDVYDHRPGGNWKTNTRLPIGYLAITPVGTVIHSEFHIDLWNAEIRCNLLTTRGSIALQCFAPSGTDVVVLSLKSTGEEAKASVGFHGESAQSCAYIANGSKDPNYERNEPFVSVDRKGIPLTIQKLNAGSDFATAVLEEKNSPDSRNIYIAIANRHWLHPQAPYGSADDAIASVRAAVKSGVVKLEEVHQAWWHSYYPASFLSLPDRRVESFYWIQLYKFASATRPNRPVVDLFGPWFKPSGWGQYWYNLNVELSYYLANVSNHPDFNEAPSRMLETHLQDLIENVPSEFQNDSSGLGRTTDFGNLKSVGQGPLVKLPQVHYEMINLPWLIQQFYLYMRHTGDDSRLRSSVYPLLKRSMHLYMHLLEKKKDGKYHLPLCYSDEYGIAKDTSLNIAIMRWGFETLLRESRRLKIEDPDSERYREVLDNLTDYHVDQKTGIMIGEGIPLLKPHRHNSHLFGVFPMHSLTVENRPDLLPVVEKSLHHFTDLDGDNCIFKFTEASSLWAAIGNGKEALFFLLRALEPQAMGSTIAANTISSEEGGWPTFETPISAARNITDLLLQSWGGTIRIFPAWPAAWQDAAFYDLRTEGAFLVSAKRSGGKTQFIGVKSLAGELCRIKTDLAEPIVVAGISASAVRRVDGLLEMDLKKGEEVVLHTQGTSPPFQVTPISNQSGMPNAWGAKKSSQDPTTK
ncbi:MAG: glycoside hydrolase family 95-like protein [bacterium]